MSAEAARLLLGKLLDRIEDTPLDERARAVVERVPTTAQSGEARRAMDAVLAAAERAGAVELVRGRGEMGHLVTGVRLRDAGLLYRHLCRRPASEVAAGIAASLRQELAPVIGGDALGALDELERVWRRARQPYGLAPERDEARRFLVALDAVLRRPAADRSDLRTFSAKAGLGSKLVERQAWRIVDWMTAMGRLPPGLTDEEARAALGLQKFAHPVLVAGQAVLRGLDLAGLGYVGVAPGDIGALEASPQAEAVLTVENFASFNRHVAEAMTGREVVVYAGGFPSQATVRALRRLCAAPGQRVLH